MHKSIITNAITSPLDLILLYERKMNPLTITRQMFLPLMMKSSSKREREKKEVRVRLLIMMHCQLTVDWMNIKKNS